MNKIFFFLLLLLSIFLISCSKNKKLLANGLTKKASQITEYTIRIEKDFLDKEIIDTLLISEKRYNNNDQIIKLNQKTLFDNKKMEIDYIYDDSNKIKKEVVKMSSDSLPFIVNYSYKDTLIYQSKAIVNYTNKKFEQIETYYYRKNNTKDKVISRQIFIDLESSDTLKNAVSTTYFDKNEVAQKIETIDNDNSTRNRKIIYKYDGKNLIEQKEFNGNNSLISTLKYEYNLDEFDNWIEQRVYENGNLNRILKREIKYK
jgi:hypothetical protein